MLPNFVIMAREDGTALFVVSLKRKTGSFSVGNIKLEI
jgi:hypothetical protein